MKDLVDIGSSSDRLSMAIKKYFIELGFNKIEIVQEKFGEEDLRLYVDDKLFIIEATGTEKNQNIESKSHQISKHIPFKQKNNPVVKVIGVFISNHDNKKSFNERNENSFGKRLIDIAKSHGYTVTTTIDLLNAFIKIKKGQLTPNDLIEKLSLTGELKILGA